MKTDRNQEAEEAFRKSLQVDPDFADALFNLGLLLSNQSRYQEAKQYWARLLAIHPDHQKAGEVKSQMKDWEI